MIFIKLFLDGIIVTGHANFKKKGEDIVCSAVSAIIQGFIKSFDDSLINEHIENPKIPLIYFRTTSEISKESMNILVTQLKCILNSAKNYLNLEITNNLIKGIIYEK